MIKRVNELRASRPFWLDAFVLFNMAFLVLDVYIAHSANDFVHWAEWIPIYFSAAATVALAGAMYQEWWADRRHAHWVRLAVGWGAIVVGIAGMVWHLKAWFFEEITIRSLVYSAPFAAPLAFTGLGFLLLMNRMVPREEIRWGQWVLFFAWGGFVGNFALSLIDHAQNGFFYWAEWIPVVVSALAVGYLLVAIVRPADRFFLRIGYPLLALQGITGLLGFVLHITPLRAGTADMLWDEIIFGAPVFAPLLFVDIAVLAALGLWDLEAKQRKVVAA